MRARLTIYFICLSILPHKYLAQEKNYQFHSVNPIFILNFQNKDCIGYILLDNVQPHHDMGKSFVLLCAGQLLQLRVRCPVCWSFGQSHHGIDILAHHDFNCHHLDDPGARVEVLQLRVPS